MKRLSATLLSATFASCFALLCASMSVPALAEVKYAVQGNERSVSSIPCVAWDASYTTCTLQAGASIDAPSLKGEISPHKDSLTTFIAQDNTSLTGDALELFRNCKSLSTVDLAPSFDTSQVTGMSSLFSGCSALSSLTLPAGFNTSAVKDMSFMFSGCSALSSLSLSDAFSLNSARTLFAMFNGCSLLAHLALPKAFDPVAASDMSVMFAGCSQLEEINIPMSSSEKLNLCAGMFANCNKLKEVNLGNFVAPAGYGSRGMFADVDEKTSAITGLIPSIEKITMLGTCILEPGEGGSLATATGSFFDYKEPLSWSAYYHGEDAEGELLGLSVQCNFSEAPDAVLTGFDEFKAYQETHPGLTTYIFDMQPVPPGPSPSPTPEPAPEPTPDPMPETAMDVKPASDADALPLTGETAGLSWMALAAIAGGIMLPSAWVLRRKREL